VLRWSARVLGLGMTKVRLMMRAVMLMDRRSAGGPIRTMVALMALMIVIVAMVSILVALFLISSIIIVIGVLIIFIVKIRIVLSVVTISDGYKMKRVFLIRLNKTTY
jgi:hypothetical protein